LWAVLWEKNLAAQTVSVWAAWWEQRWADWTEHTSAVTLGYQKADQTGDTRAVLWAVLWGKHLAARTDVSWVAWREQRWADLTEPTSAVMSGYQKADQTGDKRAVLWAVVWGKNLAAQTDESWVAWTERRWADMTEPPSAATWVCQRAGQTVD
jgi:hypothetical protein